MIAKLKTECGYQWTNKLEGMFKDVQLSKELMSKFKKLYDTEKQLDIQLEVNVCTTGYWPSSKSVPGILPKDLETACEKYKRFYLNQHSGHKLEWRLDQGQAEITVDFAPTMRRGLILSTYQMMIFLVFNSAKIVSFKQILDITGIPKYEIANHLLTLAHPKVHLLLKKPDNKKLEDTHQFMINPKYKSQLKKVVVPLLKAVEKDDVGDKKEKKTIELQRRHQMDAAIVRIMKTRKKLRHNLLVAEVIQQLSARFQPKPNDIKKRIEALIEQEYLERDAQDRGMYNYLA
jgi:cullin 3